MLNKRKYQKIIRATSLKLIGARIITERQIIAKFIVMTAMTVRMAKTVKMVETTGRTEK